MAYLQKGYLCVSNGRGQIRQGGSTNYPLHRLIYEETHGVVLSPEFVVHHINGDKLDNRPENLEALLRAEHPNKHRYRRRPGERRCSRCETWKPEAEFSLSPDGRHGYCSLCKRDAHREWVSENRDRVEEYRRRRNAKYRQEHPNARTRLTDDDVRAIRVDSRPGRVVAEQYRISRWHVYDIKAGRKRAEVPA